MRRFVLVAFVVLLASCSTSHKSSTPTTSTTITPTTSGTVAPTTTTTSPATTTTESPTTTTTVASPAGPRIVHFSGPAATQHCNAPTFVQLSWLTAGATRVVLTIDGGSPLSYPNGARSPLVYLACDGRAHTYTLTAYGAGATRATASVTVRTQLPA